MATSNVFSRDEAKIFFTDATLWSCNCGSPRYINKYFNTYSTIICECGHELTLDEFYTVKLKYRSAIMEKENEPYIDKFRRQADTQSEKYDQGKPQADLLLGFSRALMEVTKLLTFGARKYEPHGWTGVEEGEDRYTAALIRHLLQETWEAKDVDSNINHDVAVAWNALARLDLRLRREEKDAQTKDNT